MTIHLVGPSKGLKAIVIRLPVNSVNVVVVLSLGHDVALLIIVARIAVIIHVMIMMPFARHLRRGYRTLDARHGLKHAL